MSYVSCFSGIGGLEGSDAPLAVCEIDPECRVVLSRKFPSAEYFPDVTLMKGIRAEAIVGGWPCQDLSVAGQRKGLSGKNSKHFYSLLEAADRIEADTIIAENVPNLLSMSDGDVFREVLRQFNEYGYKYCSWRTLDAQHFGLPHSRKRVFMIASNSREHCFSLFREIPEYSQLDKPAEAAGFYWTAGSQSICYSEGFVPTIKVGSSLSIPSPPAVHYDHIIRQLTPYEVLALQGFESEYFEDVKRSAMYRMAGNAVAVPVGRFVVDGVLESSNEPAVPLRATQDSLFPLDMLPPKSAQPSRNLGWTDGFIAELEIEFPAKGNGNLALTPIPKNGFYDGIIKIPLLQIKHNPAKNLIDFLDTKSENLLSKKGASGLLRRLSKSGLFCPESLETDLESICRG